MDTTRPVPVHPSVTLSPREREVLTLVVRDGMSDKRVAKQLGIAYGTVRTHIHRIMTRNPSKKRPRAALTDLYYGVNGNTDHKNSD